MILVRLDHVGKEYGTAVRSRALMPIDLELRTGEMTLLLGPSGSGKTTLLNLLGGLDHPSEGTVTFDGQVLNMLGPRALTRFRRESVGFVFQFFNLVPSLTARENVLVAAELRGGTNTDVDSLLRHVGLQGLEDRFPAEMSGGQQQRVAIARALAKSPKILLADEPTGALDHETGLQMIRLLQNAAKSQDCAVIVVTHDETLKPYADRIIRLRDGQVVSDERGASTNQDTRGEISLH